MEIPKGGMRIVLVSYGNDMQAMGGVLYTNWFKPTLAAVPAATPARCLGKIVVQVVPVKDYFT